ncbi:MAG: alcohol dehydrogenase catalytic domain-containing protein, partial [Acidobacteriota bacterium]
MKTAFLYGSRDLRLEEIPAPSPGPGEVLVRIGAAGICGSDLHRYRGDDPWSPTQVCQPQLGKPRRLGHELAGVVVELGRGVHGLEAGQRVGVEPMQLAGCGACPPCRRGDYHLCGGRDHDPQRRRSAGFSELDVADVG